eukprot:1252884-Prymnesium_polylepis.1
MREGTHERCTCWSRKGTNTRARYTGRSDSKKGGGGYGSHAATGASSTWRRRSTRLAAGCRPQMGGRCTCTGKWSERHGRPTCGTTTA